MWDQNTQATFERIKQLFCESLLLYFPDANKEYYLETNASGYALGALLYQLNFWPVELLKVRSWRTSKQKTNFLTLYGACKSSEHICKVQML